MSLIFKIAAGIIIGSLVVQIITMKMIDHKSEAMGEALHVAQQLRNKSIVLMNSVHRHYNLHGSLPNFLHDLDCSPHGECAMAEDDSVFYITYKGEWILIQPYVMSTDIEYHCEATLLDRYDPRFHHCIEIEESDIPRSIRNSVY